MNWVLALAACGQPHRVNQGADSLSAADPSSAKIARAFVHWGAFGLIFPFRPEDDFPGDRTCGSIDLRWLTVEELRVP